MSEIGGIERIDKSQLPLQDRTQLDRLGKNYLFKGVMQPSTFEYYFTAGGIRPHPGRSDTWITNHITRSLPWSFSPGSQKLDTCFAVIDRSALDGNTFKSTASLASRNPWSSYREYSGQETIGWDKLLRLFVTEGALAQIKAEFDKIQPPTISWDDFMGKVHVIEPGRRVLEQELLQFLSERTK